MSQASARNMARATVSGAMWTYAAHYSGKALVFVSTIILARLLSQEDFGLAGYALVAIGFLDVLSDLGVGAALIYHHDDPRASDTAFWLGMIIGLTLCALAWFGAPLVGEFFQDQRAVPITQALAWTFPIGALGNVHDALLRKGLAFNRRFIPDLSQAVVKGAFSIALAFYGFGAWSLVLGQVAGKAASTGAYWFALHWRPSFRFDRTIARTLLGYGMNIVWVNVLGIVLLNADYLFIGRFLGAAALGVYTLAFRIPELVIMQFCNIIAQVVFPVYARMRDDPLALTRGFLATTRYVALVTMPLGLGLAFCAEPFVLTFFGERWVDAIPALRAIALYALLLSLAYNAGDVYKAQGRPDVLIWLALLRMATLLPALWWAVGIMASVEAVGWVQTASAFVFGIVYLVVAARMLRTSFLSVAEALNPAVLGGLMMTPVVLAMLGLTASIPPAASLAATIVAGAVAYCGCIWWLRRDLVLELSRTLRETLARR